MFNWYYLLTDYSVCVAVYSVSVIRGVPVTIRFFLTVYHYSSLLDTNLFRHC